MSSGLDNPIAAYIKRQMKHFGNECKRLKNKQPLVEYKALVDTFFFIGRRLGTIEHEVALARLDSEFILASKEARNSWQSIWHDFKVRRLDAIKTEVSLVEHEGNLNQIISELEDSYSKLGEGDEEFRRSMRAVLDTLHQTTDSQISLGKGWKRGPWLFLWGDLGIFSVYLRYFAAKSAFFIFRHSFIFVTSILIFGIFYSQAAKHLVEWLANLAPQWPWIAAVLTVSAYLLKKYYLDSKLKAWQKSLESRRLRPLAFQLLVVRAMALASRTFEQK